MSEESSTTVATPSSIDDLLDGIDGMGGRFESKQGYLLWLFEFACQYLENEGVNPVGNGRQIHELIVGKIRRLYDNVRRLYESEEVAVPCFLKNNRLMKGLLKQ